ncbi:hypothetical protein, partial [Streptococcus pneumoniae]|uniref:hypothetical protein n=1 Tax=Streptococcus pneumoniae TaxID=1313 RepID=UPI001E4F1CFD
TGYIGPNLMRGEWSTQRDDEDRTTAEYVLKSATDTRLAAAEAMADVFHKRLPVQRRQLWDWMRAR